MESYTLYCNLCSDIAKNFYNELIANKELLKKLSGYESSWDLLSHSEEENETYKYYWAIIRRNTISIVVFEALAIESYINLYGYYNLKEKFNKDYEYRPTLKKLCDLCEDVTKKKFPKGEKLYCQLTNLFKKRDDLVHFKSESIIIKGSSEEEFNSFISKHIGSTTDIELDQYIILYDDLRNKLKELEGCELDVVDKQKKDTLDSILSNIADMFSA